MKSIRQLFKNVKQLLQSLSFRTGVIVLLSCIPFYVLSFAQMMLPISTAAKGLLWTVLFGLSVWRPDDSRRGRVQAI